MMMQVVDQTQEWYKRLTGKMKGIDDAKILWWNNWDQKQKIIFTDPNSMDATMKKMKLQTCVGDDINDVAD